MRKYYHFGRLFNSKNETTDFVGFKFYNGHYFIDYCCAKSSIDYCCAESSICWDLKLFNVVINQVPDGHSVVSIWPKYTTRTNYNWDKIEKTIRLECKKSHLATTGGMPIKIYIRGCRDERRFSAFLPILNGKRFLNIVEKFKIDESTV